MTDTPRCEPHADMLHVDADHWVELHDKKQVVRNFDDGLWTMADGRQCTPEAAARYKWRYIAPVATPSEVEDLHTRIVLLTHAMQLAVGFIKECPDAPRDPTSLPEAVKTILLEALGDEA